MPEFFNVLPLGEALRVLLERLEPAVESEFAPTEDALGRVTAREITSPEDLPAFPRSTMDGYSVRAADTFGASEGLPAYLEVAGEVRMGLPPEVRLATGQAAIAYTGGMLADAVVMVENTQSGDQSTIEVLRPVAPGENVVQMGEDVRSGETVLPKGHVVRPQDIGGLLALGITKVAVARRPRVSIVSTGDELVTPEATPGPGQVRDVNTYTISSLVMKAGGVPIPVALEGDDYEAQRGAAVEALSAALAGCSSPPEPHTVRARLLRDVASQAGREDHVQVRLVRSDGELCAEPVFGKSNLVYTLVRADGVLTVPLDEGGLYAGAEVAVRVY